MIQSTSHITLFIPAVSVYSVVAGSLYYYLYHKYHLHGKPVKSLLALSVSATVGAVAGIVTLDALETWLL